MILGIDAYNIRAGGCVTHLCEILKVVNPKIYGFNRVVVWGNAATLAKIDDRDWLCKVHVPLLERALMYRIFWHRFMSKKIVQHTECNLLFVPGGSNANGFYPIVTMSQNMLPFEWHELWRYRSPLAILRLLIIRWTQIRSFRKADGVIFLTKYAYENISEITGKMVGKSTIIPHGINPRFCLKPRVKRLTSDFSDKDPCRILYVSALYAYKHQWHVAEAVALLREKGIPIMLELVGPPAEGMQRLKTTMDKIDPKRKFIKFKGEVPHETLSEFYGNADIGLFASSCENMPNILIEKMAASLPIACSNMGPMPEILGDAGIYFNPLDPNDIAFAIHKLIKSHDLRSNLAKLASVRAQKYSWKRCADETFGLLADIAKNKNSIST
jgi:glycosyltransferase involved in cell wall biosynthesis